MEARSVGDNVSDSFLPSLSLSLSPTLHSPSTRRAAPAIAKGQRQLAELENAAARHTFQGRERRMQTTARTIQSKLNSTVSLFHSRAAFTPATRARARERRSESLLLSLLLLRRSTSTRSGQGSLRFREKEKSEGKSEVEKEKKSKNHSEKSLGCYLEKQKRHSLFIRLFSRRSLAH